jgi:hypothetical protein
MQCGHQGLWRSGLGADVYTKGHALTLHRITRPFDVLLDDQLPMTVPRLSDFDYGTIAISARDPTRGIEFAMYGVVNEITTIPEPKPATFLLTGILALWFSYRSTECAGLRTGSTTA